MIESNQKSITEDQEEFQLTDSQKSFPFLQKIVGCEEIWDSPETYTGEEREGGLWIPVCFLDANLVPGVFVNTGTDFVWTCVITGDGWWG